MPQKAGDILRISIYEVLYIGTNAVVSQKVELDLACRDSTTIKLYITSLFLQSDVGSLGHNGLKNMTKKLTLDTRSRDVTKIVLNKI
jgi:hypothetical protein